MKKLLLAVPLALFLTACGAPSVDDLIEDPELFSEVTSECQQLMMQGKDVDTEECKNARLAAVKMADNLMKGMMKQFAQ